MNWHRSVSALAAAVLLAGCGGGGSGGRTGTVPIPVGRVVDVYASVPPHAGTSTQSDALINGIRLALRQAHGRAGRFRVHLTVLDGGAADNARRVVVDPRAVYYIGELTSATSEASAPILNEGGIPQVSPGSTYVGLTEAIPGATAPGEPRVYFPTGRRTFMSLVPPDTIQAAAQLESLRAVGCTRLALANDHQSYGIGLAAILAKEAVDYGVTIVSNTPIASTTTDYHTYAETIRAQGAQCLAYAGTSAAAGVRIARDVNAVLPSATIIAPAQLCRAAWTNAKRGGVPPIVDPHLLCTRPTLPVGAYPGGRQFLTSYRRRFGHGTPSSDAIIGYEAMKLGLDSIRSLGRFGDNRPDLLRTIFATSERRSVLGTYSFTPAGETTLASCGLYRVNAAGDPVFYRTVTPTKYISGSS